MTVTAQYESTAPQLIISQVTANAGDTNVTVTITIKNNPGVIGASFKLTYDSTLTLTGSAKGEAWSSLTYTKPGVYASPCNFGWDGVDIADTSNGIILTLTFDVASTASGTCNISVSYNNGDIFDDDWNSVAFEVTQGAIIIE